MMEEIWHIAASASALILLAVVCFARARLRTAQFCANCRKKHEARPDFMNAFDFWDIYCRSNMEA